MIMALLDQSWLAPCLYLFVIEIKFQVALHFFKFGLSHCIFEVFKERVIISILFEPGAKIVEIKSLSYVNDSQKLEDSGGLFKLCFVELFFKQFAEAISESIDQSILIINQ
jgi:hypothetical protein